MKVFAIIVIYNGLNNNWIQKCLDSILQSNIPIQVIAIDNNSSDNSVAYIKKHYPQVLLIENKENKGFGGANNQGMNKALELGGEYFFLLNQDAWVEVDTIQKLIQVAVKNEDYGIISPVHLNGKGDALDYNFSNYVTPQKCPGFYSDAVTGNFKNEIYPLAFMCAAAWLLPKRSLEIIGGFNPLFSHYAEDNNYCDRVLFHDFKIGVVPKTYICHDRAMRENVNVPQNIEYRKRKFIQEIAHPKNRSSVSELLNNLEKAMVWYNRIRLSPEVREELIWKIELLKSKKELIDYCSTLEDSDAKYIYIQ